MNYKNKIDFTNLKVGASKNDISYLCERAQRNGYYSVCVNPTHVKHARQCLRNSEVKVCTVIGFPLGANTLSSKLKDVETAYHYAVDEFDLVPNFSKFYDGDFTSFVNDITMIKKATRGRVLKVILETSLFYETQITQLATLAMAGGADYLKTSTGTIQELFTEKIKTICDLLELTQGTNVKIKASGGIDGSHIEQLINLGVHRIGTSKEV